MRWKQAWAGKAAGARVWAVRCGEKERGERAGLMRELGRGVGCWAGLLAGLGCLLGFGFSFYFSFSISNSN